MNTIGMAVIVLYFFISLRSGSLCLSTDEKYYSVSELFASSLLSMIIFGAAILVLLLQLELRKKLKKNTGISRVFVFVYSLWLIAFGNLHVDAFDIYGCMIITLGDQTLVFMYIIFIYFLNFHFLSVSEDFRKLPVFKRVTSREDKSLLSRELLPAELCVTGWLFVPLVVDSYWRFIVR